MSDQHSHVSHQYLKLIHTSHDCFSHPVRLSNPRSIRQPISMPGSFVFQHICRRDESVMRAEQMRDQRVVTLSVVRFISRSGCLHPGCLQH